MKFKIAFVMFFGGVLCSANLLAQQDSIFADINYIRKNNAWLISNNAIGLRHFSLPKISTAELYFNKANGDFKNYHQSNDSYQYGLSTASIYRLSPRVVVQGNISYDNFKGKNMTGSAFIDPYQNPFDIVEVDERNKGIKQYELYHIEGAIGIQLSHKLSIGGKIDYNAGNYAKTRDLRHVNKLLDMTLSIGVGYQLNDALELGLNYNYLRRIESIYFNTYGNTDIPYYSIIDFGSFYGLNEIFSRYGYTAEGTIRPLTNNTNGLSAQIAIKLSPTAKWFNEFSYGQQEGYFGQEGTASKPLTVHNANRYGYKGQLSIIKSQLEHHFILAANYQNLINKENVFRPQTSTGGVTQVIYYGQREVLDKQLLEGSLEYTFFKDVNKGMAKWELGLNATYFHRQQTTSLYTYYRDQTINSYQLNAKLKKNIVKSTQLYGIAIGLGYGAGGGVAKYDGVYTASSENQKEPPYSQDSYLYQEYEYFTKPRFMGNIALQYGKRLKQPVMPYAKLTYNYTKAFDTQFLGGNFNIIGASIGCNF